MSKEEKTTGEKLVDLFTKISEALEELREKGIPNRLLVLYIQDKTKLAKRDILKVLDAIIDFKNEFQRWKPWVRKKP